MTALRLALSADEFRQLPRNPAYEYEYHAGIACVRPRPRFYHAVLDLHAAADLAGADAAAVLRPLRDADWEALAPVFAAAFEGLPPFGHLDGGPRREAARKSLAFTRGGGDGPLIDRACLVATGDDDRPHAAIVVTLLPEGNPADHGTFHWPAPPPPDAVARRLGRPHLTWVFVAPPAGAGVGTALLRAAAASLRQLGFRQLASTFLLGNHSSLLWHWRCGFRLASHPTSRRRWNDPLSGSSW